MVSINKSCCLNVRKCFLNTYRVYSCWIRCDRRRVKELDLLKPAQTAKFLKVVVAFRYTETVIDVDGSGPIPPVAVRCEFFPDGRNITYVDHSQMESTRVRKSFVLYKNCEWCYLAAYRINVNFNVK